MGKPILCVDFDGVLHSYSSGWKGVENIPDEPVAGAIQWLSETTEFFNIHIYSSRSKEQTGIEAMKNWLTHWMTLEFGDALKAEELIALLTFSHEKPAAFLTIDDRALCFNGDWNQFEAKELLKFKAWNKIDQTAKQRASEVIAAGEQLAKEMRWMLNTYPDRRGGLYEAALVAWDKATGRKTPSLKPERQPDRGTD